MSDHISAHDQHVSFNVDVNYGKMPVVSNHSFNIASDGTSLSEAVDHVEGLELTGQDFYADDEHSSDPSADYGDDSFLEDLTSDDTDSMDIAFEEYDREQAALHPQPDALELNETANACLEAEAQADLEAAQNVARTVNIVVNVHSQAPDNGAADVANNQPAINANPGQPCGQPLLPQMPGGLLNMGGAANNAHGNHYGQHVNVGHAHTFPGGLYAQQANDPNHYYEGHSVGARDLHAKFSHYSRYQYGYGSYNGQPAAAGNGRTFPPMDSVQSAPLIHRVHARSNQNLVGPVVDGVNVPQLVQGMHDLQPLLGPFTAGHVNLDRANAPSSGIVIGTYATPHPNQPNTMLHNPVVVGGNLLGFGRQVQNWAPGTIHPTTLHVAAPFDAGEFNPGYVPQIRGDDFGGRRYPSNEFRRAHHWFCTGTYNRAILQCKRQISTHKWTFSDLARQYRDLDCSAIQYRYEDQVQAQIEYDEDYHKEVAGRFAQLQGTVQIESKIDAKLRTDPVYRKEQGLTLEAAVQIADGRKQEPSHAEAELFGLTREKNIRSLYCYTRVERLYALMVRDIQDTAFNMFL